MSPRRGLPYLFGILTLVLAVMGPNRATTQPLRDRVLDDVSISGRCLRVTFSFPLQYLRHFPFDSGSTLRIRFRVSPAAGRIDGDALFNREVARPPGRRALHIVDVTFEGDVAGGPYLTITFDRDVHFKVAQGSDFRSFIVAVQEDGTVPPCFPKT